MLPAGQRRVVSGRVEIFDGIAQMVHPDHILRPGETLPPYEPVYPADRGADAARHDQRRPRGAARRPARVDRAEPKRRREWPGWREALATARADPPGRLAPAAPARERLAYDELLARR